METGEGMERHSLQRRVSFLLSKLSDEVLIDSYKKAVLMKLHESFIELLQEELKRRGIETEDDRQGDKIGE
jgi:hypothetical protein